MPPAAPFQIVAVGGATARVLLEDSGLPHLVVDDCAGVAEVSRQFEPDIAVFDLLSMSPDEFAAIAGRAATVSLSPVFDRLGDVDVIFHRTSVPDPNWHFPLEHPEIRKGLKYAVVADSCERIPTETYRQTLSRDYLSVAVSMGGADAANKTLEVVRTLRENEHKLLLWVLLGEGYSHSYQDLVDCARGARHEIILAKTNESMWHILSTCAVCILAGGTTTYQAAYAGLPSINILESADRRFLTDELVEAGACVRLGDTLGESLGQLNAEVERLDSHRDELLAAHLTSRELIDGQGASRIARELLELGHDR
jgi:spore coat polysaccharide biosynthesis predicted glycosyltransferase SpsG